MREGPRGDRCEGDGVEGSGSGREIPESGLTFEKDGEVSGPVDDELGLERCGSLEVCDRGEVPFVVESESGRLKRVRLTCGVIDCKYEYEGAGGG